MAIPNPMAKLCAVLPASLSSKSALPDTLRYEQGGVDDATLERLKAMGYALKTLGRVEGSLTAIMRVPRGYEGMIDPRSAGAAVGY